MDKTHQGKSETFSEQRKSKENSAEPDEVQRTF
jgi:hypothetical protein